MGASQVNSVPAFSGLTLGQAQTRTVELDLGVQEARAAATQRAAALHLAQIMAVPHLVGDYTLTPQSLGNNATVEQHLTTVGAGISLNEILAAPATIRSSAQDLLAAQRDGDAAVLIARESAVRFYYGALSAIAIERFRREDLNAAMRDLRAAELRAESGEAPRLDVIRAQVTVSQARADLALAGAQRADAVGALAAATGTPTTALTAVVEQSRPPATLYAIPAAVTRALATRPEIAALRAAIEARIASLSVARQSGLPTVTAAGGYAAGVDTGVPVHGPQANVHVEVPLASPAGPETAVALAQLNVARAQLVEAQRTVALQVSAAIRDATGAAEAASAAQTAARAAAQALLAVEIGYRNGASSSLDVADARRTYVQASIAALVAEYALVQADALIEVLVP